MHPHGNSKKTVRPIVPAPLHAVVNVGTAAGVGSLASRFSAFRSIARLLGSQRNRQLTDIAHPQTGTGTVGESLAATRVPSTLRPPKTRRVCPEDHLPGLARCPGDAPGEDERMRLCLVDDFFSLMPLSLSLFSSHSFPPWRGSSG